MLALRVLRQFEARLGNVPVLLPSRPAQSLLAYLALSAGTAHRREKRAGLLWPDADEDNAPSNLRHALWRIRKVLESEGDAATYSPDGRRLITAGSDAIRVHVLPIDDLVSLARSRLTRWWTDEECHKLLHRDACPDQSL